MLRRARVAVLGGIERYRDLVGGAVATATLGAIFEVVENLDQRIEKKIEQSKHNHIPSLVEGQHGAVT